MLDQIPFENDNTPEEVKRTLIQFLGQTYQEVSQLDSNIVSPNQFLAPKKHEFQRTAERVMNETLNSTFNKNVQQPQNNIPVHKEQPKPYLDGGSILPPPPNDPNQMEFSFDNSVTAITINNKLDSLEKKLKKIDKMMEKMLSFIDSHESKDLKQE